MANNYAANVTSPYAMSGADLFFEEMLQSGSANPFGFGSDARIQGNSPEDARRIAEQAYRELTPGERATWDDKARYVNQDLGLIREYDPSQFSAFGKPEQANLLNKPPSQQEILESQGPDAFKARVGEGETRDLYGGIQATRKGGKVFMTGDGPRKKTGGASGKGNSVELPDDDTLERSKQFSAEMGERTQMAPFGQPMEEAPVSEPDSLWKKSNKYQLGPETGFRPNLNLTLPVEQPQGSPEARTDGEGEYNPNVHPNKREAHSFGSFGREIKQQLAPVFEYLSGSGKSAGRKGKTYNGPAFNPVPGSPSPVGSRRTQSQIRQQGPARFEDIFTRT